MTEVHMGKRFSKDHIDFVVKKFNDLTNHELKAIYQLRQRVFIIEQDCPYPDIDEADLTAWHLFHQSKQCIDAYARILIDGQNNFHIGRVVVAVDNRHQGLGQTIMKAAIACCHDAAANRKIIISAQSHLKKFYQALGFQETGDYYLEDNIPHLRMILKPSK